MLHFSVSELKQTFHPADGTLGDLFLLLNGN